MKKHAVVARDSPPVQPIIANVLKHPVIVGNAFANVNAATKQDGKPPWSRMENYAEDETRTTRIKPQTNQVTIYRQKLPRIQSPFITELH